MKIRNVLIFVFLTITIVENFYSIGIGILAEDYKEVISGLYGISVLGLLSMFVIEMSEGYVKHNEHRGLLIGLISLLLILAISLLIGMFMVDYNWFLRILEILMILLLVYSLNKAIKRRSL